MNTQIKKKLLSAVFVLIILQGINFLIIHFGLLNVHFNNNGVFGIIVDNRFLFFFTGVSLVAISYYFIKFDNSIVILALIVGGISNLLDRIIWGGVVDFIHILDFPIFNIADVLISMGVVWYFFDMIRKSQYGIRYEKNN